MPPRPDAFERPKRFYKAAAVRPEAGGFAVVLDGRIPRSPAGHRLILPTEPLAALVAAEWQAQGEFITIAVMPATRLAYSALDGVPQTREEVAASVARYAGTDLLCYFADGPHRLVERQEAEWTPLLRWADRELGLLFLRGQGVIHQDQPPPTLRRVHDLALQLDDFALAGLAFAASLFGSAILALALQRGHVTGSAAFHASRLDETFQEEQWGLDAEAAARADLMAADAVMVEGWFAALR